MENKIIITNQTNEGKQAHHPFMNEMTCPSLVRDYYERELRALRDKLDYLEKINHALNEKIKELAKDKESYRDLFENAPVGCHVLAPDGTILEINQAALEMLGYDREELEGKMYEETIIASSSKEIFNDHYKELKSRGTFSNLELNLVDKDGHELPVLLSVNSTYDEKHDIVRHRAVVRDISKFKLLEAELLRTERYRALGTMCRNIAHNFNNLLASVIGNIQVMQLNTELDEKQKKSLNLMYKAAEKMAGLVIKIQSFVARANEYGEAEPQYVNINDALRQTIELTRPTWQDQMREKNVEISVTFEPVPIPEVKGNPLDYRTVFYNILTNAIEAIEAKARNTKKDTRGKDAAEINITATTVKKYPEGPETVEITFNDTGVGMSKEVLEEAVDPLYSTKGLVGVGMGLSVAYSIINKAGGKLLLESSPGKGTLARILLPTARHYEKIAEALPLAKARNMQKHVLVAEDDDLVRDLLETMLQSLNCNVSAVSDGRAALALFNEKIFNLVLVDWYMPVMSGIELARKIRETKANVPVFVMTGSTDKESLNELKALGVENIIKKPFVIEDIRNMLTRVFGEGEVSKNGGKDTCYR